MKYCPNLSTVTAVTLALFLSNVSAQSDDQRPRGQKPPPPNHNLEALGLTQPQEQELHLIVQSHREEMHELRRNGASCEDQQVLRSQLNDALGEVLNEEQLVTFHEQKPRGKRRGRGGDACAQEGSQ